MTDQHQTTKRQPGFYTISAQGTVLEGQVKRTPAYWNGRDWWIIGWASPVGSDHVTEISRGRIDL